MVPTLRGENKKRERGTLITGRFLLNEHNRLSELARKVVLRDVKQPFPSHNKAVYVYCLLMEHAHSKFRSSHRHGGLLIVCAEVCRNYNKLKDAFVEKKLTDLELLFQAIIDVAS